MNTQREVIYTERRQMLEGQDVQEWVQDMIGEVTGAYIAGATEGFPEESDLEQLWTALATLYPISLTVEGVEAEAGGREALSREYLQELVADDTGRVRRAVRRSWAARSCVSSSVASCSACSTASGASTCTRWTTCARASACGPTHSATRSWSTSARASSCSPR